MPTQQPASDSAVHDYWDTHTLASGLNRDVIEHLAGVVRVGPGGRETVPVYAPFTRESLGAVPSCIPADVEIAVRRAREVQPEWAATSLSRRRSILLRFHDLLLDRQQQVLDLIQLESGKARRHALEEILDTALVARHYAIHAKRYLRPKRYTGAIPVLTTAWEHHHPVGVVGFIAPWNFPLILSITDVIAALMAGNAVVLRPDLQSSLTALWAAALLHESGVPPDILQVVTGPGRIIGPALIDRVDFVMFTGSTSTGKVVARQASDRLIGYSLELGGKNPMIVLPDADLEAAVEGLVRGAFVGAGQVCVSIERAYIPHEIFDEFTARLVDRVSTMKLSPAMSFGADMGSLTIPQQLASVSAHVQDAVEKGATLLAGGKPRPDIGPLFYAPTVLTGVTPAMKVYAEETFGPVVSLYRYTRVDEAIDRANDTPYGLNASVWSKSIRNAKEVAKRIRAGTVNINETYAATWTATKVPIGGMRESGMGRRHGAEGILKYTEAQTLAVQRGMPLAPPPFFEEDTYAKLITALLRIMRRIPGLR